MTNLVPTNDSDYVKDVDTNAVINTNTTAFRAYKMQRETSRNNEQLSKELTDLKSEFGEIKNLLGQLLHHVNTNRQC